MLDRAKGGDPGPAQTIAVVLNYRTADDTIRSVQSLQSGTSSPSLVIVVDNASGDGSPARIAASLPAVRLIEEKSNVGFSAGCNTGIREALRLGAARVLLLNADAVVSATALAAMEHVVDEDSAIGIVGPIVLSMSRPQLVESSGIRYSPGTGRMWNAGFGRALPPTPQPSRIGTDAVTACAMLVRRDVFDRVGLFDDDYFFGFEDLDFCLRAAEAGFHTVVAGEAIVEHKGHASIGRTSRRRVYFATRNHLLVAHRRALRKRSLTGWVQTGTILCLNLVHTLFSSEVSGLDGFRAFVRGARDYFAGRFGDSGTA